VTRRTTTSIMLLTVLVAGILTPTGMCALMCARHSRTESQRHCVPSSDTMPGMDAMPGMAHDHSATNHFAVDAVSLVMVSQLCQTSCVSAERLNASRKVVLQVTVVQTAGVFLDRMPDSLVPGFIGAWRLDSSPPSPFRARTASFSILRI
jgi:hypothetical protein